ncbi:GNAT family N-acetyltransferase [Sporomusa aerivorans]|uniref:GNAT family N-acetyltransferase n=1 Tax=Sporomusa aerivorans TaxID=204936 RepID=UPI00352B3AF1
MSSLADSLMQTVQLQPLTAGHFTEALEVFKNSGWDDDSLLYLQAEMKAFLQGDILGYIRARFIVATLDDHVIGVAAWAPSMCSFAVYELSWATVSPAWRHRGINTMLVQERLKQIRLQHGSGPFTAIVYTWNNPMYAGLGFSCSNAGELRPGNGKEKELLMARFAAEKV